MIVCDFDGVITDNRVWTDQEGRESVAADRADGMHIGELQRRGVEVLILSSEPNPVVRMRADKMGVQAVQGVALDGKGKALRQVLAEKRLDASRVVYLGNDVNDLPAFEVAGWAVAVADSHPAVLRAADHVLSRPGGRGALRELCDLILQRFQEKE
jgi:N-acylneuraminate cytidylyltransferase